MCHICIQDVGLFTHQTFRNVGASHLPLVPTKTLTVDLGRGHRTNLPRTQLKEILTPPKKDRRRYDLTQDPQEL